MKLATQNSTQPCNDFAKTTPSIAIFGLPKPYRDSHTRLIQRNSIASWSRLGPQVEVILLGNEEGIEETAKEFGALHSGEIRANEFGTPLLSGAFKTAADLSKADILVYCNCDVILSDDLIQTIHLIQADPQIDSFVAFGRRTDLKVEREINFDCGEDVEKLLADAKIRGRKAPVVCKEYFAYTRDLFQQIPDFAVGRGNWDNWMIANSKSLGVPVINVSNRVNIIHQDHDYQHLNRTRLSCYVSGDEAKRNQELAGGKNIVSGSTGTWTFGPGGLKKLRASWLNRSFWCDLPRFARMVARLPFQR